MNEIRLTFRTRDFGAISQVLVEMGIGFTVEPAKEPADDVVPAAAAREPAGQRPKPPKKAAKAVKAGGTKGSAKGAPLSLADRLREAATRNQPTADPAAFEPPDKE